MLWPVVAAGPGRGPDGQEATFEHLVALGPLDASELRRRLGLAAVFVSLAAYEPFGLAVLEAALSGCALVLSDIPTFREIWGDAALFVPPYDAPAARAAINRLITDGELRVLLAARARQRALVYSPEACARRTLAVYRRVLDETASRRDGELLRAAG